MGRVLFGLAVLLASPAALHRPPGYLEPIDTGKRDGFD
jgi:hypothetical protein